MHETQPQYVSMTFNTFKGAHWHVAYKRWNSECIYTSILLLIPMACRCWASFTNVIVVLWLSWYTLTNKIFHLLVMTKTIHHFQSFQVLATAECYGFLRTDKTIMHQTFNRNSTDAFLSDIIILMPSSMPILHYSSPVKPIIWIVFTAFGSVFE